MKVLGDELVDFVSARGRGHAGQVTLPGDLVFAVFAAGEVLPQGGCLVGGSDLTEERGAGIAVRNCPSSSGRVRETAFGSFMLLRC